ncbi:hypothetical protein MA6G0728R_2727 [Mycobacteroides abscessus 6G-0728-R]|uniref:Uncharacterized protein n=1 Tax=Mycobacteroides abscessus 1948 TaxID=1299323 RepID=A0A829QEJ8_9MYCO|nr:hypothetical protein MA6G0212_2786 [Mycobacteroides abscessus 6G-0212]EIU98399.1 hypothetical protein MA6G0728R_2727 [Mycobacteroides abscessus 6G-0728-R]EUA61231.1 hypothetical protein I542_1370 [Mycobacteroides abscessus 1948]
MNSRSGAGSRPGCPEMSTHLAQHQIRPTSQIDRLTEAHRAIGDLMTRIPR